jgi:hypothetical protein
MQEPCPQLAAVVVEPQRVFVERAVLGLGATLDFGDHGLPEFRGFLGVHLDLQTVAHGSGGGLHFFLVFFLLLVRLHF